MPILTWLRRWKEHLDLRAGIAMFAVLVIAINAVILIGGARKEKYGVLQSAALSNAREATGFEQYASRTIGLADTATRFLAREFVSSGANIDLADMFADGTIDPQLFDAATIIAPDGTALASSEAHPDAARFENLRHQDFAAPPADGGGLQVGQPIPASGGRGQMIPFFRRLDLPGAGFAGFVVLEMAPAHFLAFDDKAAPRSEVIALIGLDRIVRARRAGQIFTSGEHVPNAIQFQPGGLLTGDLVATSPIDNIRRLFHIRQVPGYPLHVIAGIREADALADVSARANSYYARALVLSGIILVLAVSVMGALTRGKRAFAQLRASEAASRAHERELRTLMESMPQLVWITDAEGSHRYFNQQWIDYTGLSLAQSVGDNWKAGFEPAEQAQALERWKQAVAKAEVYETEYRLRRADGAYRWMLARAVPLRNAEGRITKWFGTSTDIHNQVIAQAQLREAQEVARVGSWSRDAHTRAHTWSDELYHILGLSPVDFVPSDDSLDEMIHPDDRPQFRRDRELPITTTAPIRRDVRIIRTDGQVRTVQHSIAVERQGGGADARRHGTIQDVTDARAREHQLREQANLLNLTRDAIIVREADETISFWNAGAERLYGWSAEEVLGNRAQDFAYFDSAIAANARRHLAKHGEWSGDVEHLRKDGSTVTVNSRWTLVRNEQRAASSVLVVNTDITEHKTLEAQLLRTQRLESIGTLASGVAHDLNNILSPIMMAAPLLRAEMSSEKRDQLVALLEQSAERGAAIVRQVLTFARGADGERVLVQPSYSLREIVEIASETFPRSITVTADYPEDLSLIEADPTQIHQVLLNLCVNARDAMPDGGVLSLSAKNFHVDEHYAAMTPGLQPGPHVLLAVSDTGTGIPPHIMDKIFDPFFTTKGVGTGTGLGLSTVLGIVRDYGGSVDAESAARGTTFRVLLPASFASCGHAQSAAAEELPRGRGETILVVDDEEAIRTVAESLLRASGYEVLLAEDGPAALAIFAGQTASKIDVVLTDVAMPVMSGIALARTLRKMQPDACIIVSAGQEDDCSPTEIDEVGIIATLPKPYTQTALLRLLDQVISPNRKNL